MSENTNFTRVKDLESTAIRARNDTVTYVTAIKSSLNSHNTRITNLENENGIFSTDSDGDVVSSKSVAKDDTLQSILTANNNIVTGLNNINSSIATNTTRLNTVFTQIFG